jgi:phosphatidylserine decarboxylase
MVKDAFYFLIPLISLSLVCLYFRWIPASLAFLLLTGFVAYFFRDPERIIPADPEAIVSPADGKVIRVDPLEGSTRVSIFLSVFDVHVNRAPVAGRILEQTYRPGRFHLAFDDRASAENEQMIFKVGDAERTITFALIAGLVARRIVPWKKEGDRVSKGDRIALIRFGSRADVMIPSGCEICVAEGDRVAGGSSILARWQGDE